MSVNPSGNKSERLERQKALLAKLEGRLFRASQLPPTVEVRARPDAASCIDGLKRTANPCGQFSMNCLSVDLGGTASPQGIRFPFGINAESIDMHAVSLLAQDNSLASIPIQKVAFIDCETTGLAGGSGTVAFLVGIGFFAEGAFVVEQYFMEDYDEEEPLMDALEGRLGDFDAFVSYNGKTYDIPLLKARFISQRRRPHLEKPHLDLLHPSRRFWRRRLPNCSLHSVENHILNLRRVSDIEGFLIPQIYFDYVRGKRRERMIPVFDHHAQDIVSLAALAARVTQMVNSPLCEEIVSAEDQVRLAGFFHHCGLEDQAIACLECAVLRLSDSLAIYTTAMHLARFYKRCGRWDEACAIWKAQIESGPGGRIEPYVELAKYYEHQGRDAASALEVVQRAIRAVDVASEWRHYINRHPDADATQEELHHRLDRLQARLTRHDGAAAQ